MHLTIRAAFAVLLQSRISRRAKDRLPVDVAKYLEQREGCDHFAARFQTRQMSSE